MRHFIAFALVLAAGVTLAQVPFTEAPEAKATFSYEDKHWQVQPTASPKPPPYDAPTPLWIPGARMIKTLELKALLAGTAKVTVIDVLDSKTRTTAPGAYWLSGAGDGRFYAAEKSRFAAALDKLTGGDKERPLVFLCCPITHPSTLSKRATRM